MIATTASNPSTATGSVGTSTGPGGYQITGLMPGHSYVVRFRDPSTQGIIYGIPTNNHAVANTKVGDSVITDTPNNPQIGGTSTIATPHELTVVLQPGKNLANQSLPLDPAGVVYDSVSRQAVGGATVMIAGPVGFSPLQHLVGAGSYNVLGATASMVTPGVGSPLPGAYQFLLTSGAPAGTYHLTVTAPGYTQGVSVIIPVATTVPSGLQGTLSNGVFTPTAGLGNVSVNVNNYNGNPPPSGNIDTTYFMSFGLTPIGGSGVVNNHIPLDPLTTAQLIITKVGDKTTAEVGDSMRYTLNVKRVDDSTSSVSTTQIVDTLPAGFRYIDGTGQLTVNGVTTSIADPVDKPGPVLVFNTGVLEAKGELTLTYRVRLGVGSAEGSGINRAIATVGSKVNCALTPKNCSNEARYAVKVGGGVFAPQACVIGKVYMDCNNNHMQDGEELGIPGVRMYMQDGTSVTSDVEGKYNVCDLDPSLTVLTLDQTTLPKGSVMTTSSSRNAGDAMSLFLDLKKGELHRADFVETSCYDAVLEQVKVRRLRNQAGLNDIKKAQKQLSNTDNTEVQSRVNHSLNSTLKFEGKVIEGALR
jgi:uncharacterized repeat protein (TIGR01451 family)